MSTPILRAAALRVLESRHADASPPLMERAGAAAAAVAVEMLAGCTHPPLILAGPGNNGGDAFVVARRLKEDGLAPRLVFAGEIGKLPPDARRAFEAWQAAGGECLDDVPPGEFGLAIDGLLGIGLSRPLDGKMAGLVERINRLPCPVLALDLPSGLDSETGRILGAAVRATRTATFIAWKPGLLTLDGPDCCGRVSVHDLGLPVDAIDGELVSTVSFRNCLVPRKRNSHKGSYGSVGILGGAPGMAGAALLAGRAALGLGAGRVHVGLLERLPVDPLQPELMLRASEEVFALATVLGIGPGLGRSEAALELLRRAVASPLPLVADADALNLLAVHPVLFRNLARRAAPTVVTPHPAEAARLLKTDTAAVQSDRVGAALELARRLNAATLLKGCGSVIAQPDGRWFIEGGGNPGLASAGTGDVLTGMAAALIAQGWPADKALLGAVHLHACAADELMETQGGAVGMTAGELVAPARRLLNRWISDA